MATKKKETRGRKPLPPSEVLTPITIRVKFKYLKLASVKALELESKYRN